MKIPRAEVIDRTYELVNKRHPGKRDLNKIEEEMRHAVDPSLRTHDGLEWRSKYLECVSLLRRLKQAHSKAIFDIEQELYRLGENE